MKITELLFKLNNPQIYTGKEINCIKKPWRKDFINICLIFPDKYEIGMSHDGIKLLYHFLNNLKNVNAERCFLPDKKSIPLFKREGIPLFSLENKIPLKNFDLVSFSLLSELNFTNVLEILNLSHIPIYAKDRKQIHPIVACGGISVINPEPLRDFFDLIAFGDGEEIYPIIIDKLLQYKKREITSKEELFRHYDKNKAIYIPQFYPLKKVGNFYLPQPNLKKIKKTTKSINRSMTESHIIVPISNVIFNRLSVEIGRGCLQNCRFCQAKSYYAPYREKSLEVITKFIQEALSQTGFESFSLSSLSAGDYSALYELLYQIPTLMTPCTDFSVPSLRPASLSPSLLQAISQFRRTGLTIVPEAGSERLRKVINKNVTNKEIFQATEFALQNGWQKIKLYFMIGLPTETMTDIDAISDLIIEINQIAKRKQKKIQIHASFSSFIPKPHTPVQWSPREDLHSLKKKTGRLRDRLRIYKNIKTDFHSLERGVMETILARGDATVGELILKAYQKGEIYSAWDSEFSQNIWQNLIEEGNFEVFLREFSIEEQLPWDFVQINFTKDHLKKEYKNSIEGQPTPPCGTDECSACRGCNYGVSQTQTIDKNWIAKGKKIPDPPPAFNKVRIFYHKVNEFRFFSHLSMIKYIERIIRKSGIGFQFSLGFHPRIKMTSLAPLPVFAQSKMEVIELFLDARLSEIDILNKLNEQLAHFKFFKVLITNHSPSLNKDLVIIQYELNVKPNHNIIAEISKNLNPNESISAEPSRILINLDYSIQGPERFSYFYKMLDPKREQTRFLTRTAIIFKSDRQNL